MGLFSNKRVNPPKDEYEKLLVSNVKVDLQSMNFGDLFVNEHVINHPIMNFISP